MYAEGLHGAVSEGTELAQGRVEVDEVHLVAGLGDGDLRTVLQDEGHGGVRRDPVLLLGAQLEGQVHVLLCGVLVVEVVQDEVVLEVLAVGDDGGGGGHDAAGQVHAAGGFGRQVDGGGRGPGDGLDMALQEGTEDVFLEVVLQVVVRLPAVDEFQGGDAAGELVHVGLLQGVAEPVQVQAVLLAGFRRGLAADLVGPDDGAAGEGGGHLHAFRGRKSGLLAQVDEDLVKRGFIGETDTFHADGEVPAGFKFGGDMGHPFGPVVGPDLLGGEGKGRAKGGQEEDRLFHYRLQIYTIGVGKRNFFVSLSG